MASGAPGEAEGRLRRHDGEYRWFLFRTSPQRDADGAIVKWYGVNTDIEDRKRAEVELRRAYDSFADAQRLSRTGNFTADIAVDEHIWSDELYRIFEIEPGTKISVQMVRDLIHPDDLAGFDSDFARSLGGVDFDQVFRIVPASGRVKHCHAVGHLIERVAGRPLFIGAIQDVTERILAAEALNLARSDLAHVARITTVGALTASIAHEVNQPLTGIITNASTCLRMLEGDHPDIDGARETARRTIRDGNRAAEWSPGCASCSASGSSRSRRWTSMRRPRRWSPSRRPTSSGNASSFSRSSPRTSRRSPAIGSSCSGHPEPAAQRLRGDGERRRSAAALAASVPTGRRAACPTERE